MNEIIFKDYYNLTTGDLDRYDRLRPYTIFDLFQENAGRNSEQLGIGYDALLKQNYAWILIKNKYQVYHYPKVSSKIIVETWPETPGRADFNRNYRILDENGKLLVEGTSKWCIIDITTRKICKSNVITYDGVHSSEKTSVELERFVSLDKSQMTYLFNHQVRQSQLDHYQHMNNAKYAEVIYDAIVLEKNEVIESMQINNLHEVRLNQIMAIYMKKEDNVYFVNGYILDSVLAFDAKVVTKKINN